MRMIISDTHFGDRSGADMLSQTWVSNILMENLQHCDELMLLGDIWEFAFQTFETAVKSSQPFFNIIRESFPDLKIIATPGNHDHHLVVRSSDEHRETELFKKDISGLFKVSALERLLRYLLPKNPIDTFYPTFTQEDVWFHHGHYLTSHANSLGWKVMDKLAWKIWGQEKRDILSISDYEALIAPLHELSYQVAQLPQGTEGQRQFEKQLNKLGNIFSAPNLLRNSIDMNLSRLRKKPDMSLMATQQLTETATPAVEFGSYSQDHISLCKVLLNLKVDQKNIVFGHTHRPNSGEKISYENKEWVFHNSGSWMYDYRNTDINGVPKNLPGSILIQNKKHITFQQLLSMDDINKYEKDVLLK